MMSNDSPPEFDPKSITIRLAQSADQVVIRSLYEASALEGQLRENDTGADIEDLDAGYFSDDGASAFWVAELDQQVVGMIGVQQTKRGTAEIRRLRVAEPFRRRGIGRRLLAHAVEFCRERGYLKVTLDVRIEREPAIALFEQLGFHMSKAREIGGRRIVDFYLDLYSQPRDTRID